MYSIPKVYFRNTICLDTYTAASCSMRAYTYFKNLRTVHSSQNEPCAPWAMSHCMTWPLHGYKG
eukprot:SAG22_NODE_136_length_18095_cov_19.897255_11_plen_64_part_00